MIESVKSKKIKKYIKGDTSRVAPNHIKNLEVILNALDTGTCIDDFNLPGKRLHKFSEKDPVVWSLDVSGNIRITFEFDGKNVQNVDYLDTH